MAMVFPAQSDAKNAPRVRFKSQTWQMGKPTLANTKGASLQGGGEDVVLYLPNGFTEDYKANWGMEDLFTGLVDAKDGRGWAASGWEALDKTLSGANGIAGITTAAKYGAGVTSFPGKFLIFQSADPNTLQFGFEMVPRSAGEAKQIADICALFKRKILPTFTGGLLTFPDVWAIQFLGIRGVGFPDGGGNSYEGMALTAAVVGYNGGGQSSLTFNDAYPVATTLKLTFQSIKHAYIEGK